MGTSLIFTCPIAAGRIRSATLAKKKRGVALNLSARIATPLFESRSAGEINKPSEPIFTGKLRGL
jgi:hypothetical protein